MCHADHLSHACAGTSTASEVSQPTDDYADLVARLQGMCFGLLGDPIAMPMEGGSTEEERTASTGSVSRFESAGSAHAFDLDLGPLTSQPRGPAVVSTKSGSNWACDQSTCSGFSKAVSALTMAMAEHVQSQVSHSLSRRQTLFADKACLAPRCSMRWCSMQGPP